MFRTLFSYFKPHIGIFLLDMCCAVLVAAVDVLYSYRAAKADGALSQKEP